MTAAELPIRQPFPWHELLRYLQARSTPLADVVTDNAYERRRPDGACIIVERRGAALQVSAQAAADLPEALERVRRLFLPQHDAAPIQAQLARSPVLAARLARVPGLRPLGAWSGFELCLRTLIGQQVSVAGAGTLMRRLVERCGGWLTPQAVVDAKLDALGMPGRRIASLRATAQALLDGRLDLQSQNWSALDAQLAAIPGYGPWTRQYLAVRLGREDDAFPHTDLGLVRAARAPSPAALLAMAESWRPYRAYAAAYLWMVA